jgi:hypothetical protein
MTIDIEQIKALAEKAKAGNTVWDVITAQIELADLVTDNLPQILTALSEAERMREALQMIEAGHTCPSAVARAILEGKAS